MAAAQTILLVDDNPDDRALVRRELEREFPEARIEEILEQNAWEAVLERGDFQAVVTDYQVRWTDGLKVLRSVKARFPDMPVIMFTNTGTEEIAVEAMKAGLDDYLIKKPVVYPRVPLALKAALDRAEAGRRARLAEAQVVRLNAQLRRAMMETHHRVKNSLQTITALVDMQIIGREGETVPRAELERIVHHVKALSVIHDALTQHARENADVSALSIQEALTRLLPLLQDIAGERRIRLDSVETMLPSNLITGLSMLINELVSNALKHGCGEIAIRFATQEGNGLLSVADDGPGFQAGFDAPQAQHTGLYLVHNVAHWDLRGTVRFTNRESGGALVEVAFPLPEEE